MLWHLNNRQHEKRARKTETRNFPQNGRQKKQNLRQCSSESIQGSAFQGEDGESRVYLIYKAKSRLRNLGTERYCGFPFLRTVAPVPGVTETNIYLVIPHASYKIHTSNTHTNNPGFMGISFTRVLLSIGFP